MLLPAGFLVSNAAQASGWESLFSNPVLDRVLESTVIISVLCACLTVPLAYVAAVVIHRRGRVAQLILLSLVLLPFWTSVIVKNFAWAVLLEDNGLVTDGLHALGIDEVQLLHNRFAVIVGMVHYLFPYAFFPIFVALVSIDSRLPQAAASLGAGRWQQMRHVLLPLTMPGLLAAWLLVFLLSLGFYVTPVVLGGPGDRMASNLIDFYLNEAGNYQAASALAMLLVVAVSAFVVLYQRLPKEGQHGVA